MLSESQSRHGQAGGSLQKIGQNRSFAVYAYAQ